MDYNTVTIRLTREERGKLSAICKQENQGVTAVLRQLINDRHEKMIAMEKLRESFDIRSLLPE